MNKHEQRIHNRLSIMHQRLDRFAIDDIALNEKHYRETLEKASALVWDALMELNHITTQATDD